jgi:hypothetical protein
MKRIIKGQPIEIEFGDYGNFNTMIPIEILKYRPGEYYNIFMRWQYLNTDCTVDLWGQDAKDVDFESFNFIPEVH